MLLLIPVIWVMRELENLAFSTLKQIYDPGEAKAIAELLMERVSGLNRSERTFNKTAPITADQEKLLRSWLDRLMQHEPVQYVLNESWFCGLKFYVDKRVLIPRPETEELVEWVIANCKFPIDELTIIDIGTGSGCIPITLKRRIRKAGVSAIDISTSALEVARKNAEMLGANVEWMEMDFLNKEARDKLGIFDIITSNPPYIPERDSKTLDRHVVEQEPNEALFVPSDDPLLFYRALSEFGKDHLKPGGFIYAEMHADYAGRVEFLFQQEGYATLVKKDMQGKERMLRATPL